MYRDKSALSALIVSSSKQAADYLRGILEGLRFHPIAEVVSIAEAKRRELETPFDLCLINTPLPDDFGIEFAEELCENSAVGVVLFVKAELAEQVSYKVEDYGVLTFPRPGTRQSIQSAVKLAAATHNRLAAFERRAVKLEAKMKEIRLINRAKWLLIDRYNMSEEEAHKYIEKTAMDNCATRGEIAEIIIRTYES